MVAFCREHGVRHEICGKLVVAVDEAERGRLETLMNRGQQNGLRGPCWLTGVEAREIEPHVRCVAAVHVPEEGITDYGAVCLALAAWLGARGVEISLGAPVTGMRRRGSRWEVTTPAAGHEADVVVNCAGLHADTIAVLAMEHPPCRIVPFRGEYYHLRQDRESLVRNLIYPAPDPALPFLGVHFTRHIGGGIEAGPNAVLALAREGYAWSTLNLRELGQTLRYAGFWRFLGHYPRTSWDELRRSWRRERFCASLQRIVPDLVDEDLAPGGAGVRAQAMRPNGELVQDFLLLTRPGAIHVLNAPSPAATASLATFEEAGTMILVTVLLLDPEIASLRDAVLDATNSAGVTTRPAWTLLHPVPMFASAPSHGPRHGGEHRAAAHQYPERCGHRPRKRRSGAIGSTMTAADVGGRWGGCA
jgi:(S)-2-hydroxyglutarate dehydrogenase